MSTASDSDDVPLSRRYVIRRPLTSSSSDEEESEGVALAPKKAAAGKKRLSARQRNSSTGLVRKDDSSGRGQAGGLILREMEKNGRNRNSVSGTTTEDDSSSDDPVERANAALRISAVIEEVRRFGTDILAVCDQLEQSLMEESPKDIIRKHMVKLGGLSEKCYLKVQAEIKEAARIVNRNKSDGTDRNSDCSSSGRRMIRSNSVDYTDYVEGVPLDGNDVHSSMDHDSPCLNTAEESAKDSGNPSSGHDESPPECYVGYLDIPSPTPVYTDMDHEVIRDALEVEAAELADVTDPITCETFESVLTTDDRKSQGDSSPIINDDIFGGLHDHDYVQPPSQPMTDHYQDTPKTSKPNTLRTLQTNLSEQQQQPVNIAVLTKTESTSDVDRKDIKPNPPPARVYQDEPSSSKVPPNKLRVRLVEPAEPPKKPPGGHFITDADPDPNREPTADEISYIVPHQPKFTVQQEAKGENPDLELMKREIECRLRVNELSWITQRAIREESSRVKRVKRNNERLEMQLERYQGAISGNQLFLDYDKTRNTFIRVHPELVGKMKPHQREGVKFMYECCYGCMSDVENSKGSGCILAHCMGLGKTLQVIALINTVICYPQLKTKRIIVVCPKSTVMNWHQEIRSWLGDIQCELKLNVFYLPDSSNIYKKMEVLRGFHAVTGRIANCLLIGYEAFRSLVFYDPSNKKGERHSESIRTEVRRVLINPGADLIILDEGHIIKNRKSQTNLAVAEVATKRRIILTGTPIQNNLNEYFCMVNFVKPAYLGSEREFNEHYAKPIKDGQHKDSSIPDIRFMKIRSFILHNNLKNFVQRKEFIVLKAFLPEKYEYVLYVPLTPVQEELYEQYLKRNPLRKDIGGVNLLEDYTFLRKIWTHPIVLERAWETAMKKKYGIKERRRAIRREHGIESSSEDDDDNEKDNARCITNVWWKQIISKDDLESLYPSNKMILLFEILKMCQERGEKCLIFSGFVMVLNMVEHFMKMIDDKTANPKAQLYGFDRFHGPWRPGMDYYRIDGGTSKSTRHEMVTKFNDPNNRVTRVFLISTKAGGQGINLVGANRVIILDTSWNPAVDQQGIFRIYRLGQEKPCYIYRLLAVHTMEEKVYSRAVTKQAMSHRVADKKQVDRNYNMAELEELYHFERFDLAARPSPAPAVDDLLSTLLWKHYKLIYRYHTHETMLDNKTENDLTDLEKKLAWNEFKKKGQVVTSEFGLRDDNVATLGRMDSQLSEPDADTQLLDKLDSACAPDYSDMPQEEEPQPAALAIPMRELKKANESPAKQSLDLQFSRNSTIFGADPYKELSFGGMSIIEEQRTKMGIKSELIVATPSQVTVTADEEALLRDLEQEAAVKTEPMPRISEYASIGAPVMDSVINLSLEDDTDPDPLRSSDTSAHSSVPLSSLIEYDPVSDVQDTTMVASTTSSAIRTTGTFEASVASSAVRTTGTFEESVASSTVRTTGTFEESATLSYERFKASLDADPTVVTSTTAASELPPTTTVTTVMSQPVVSAAPIIMTRSMKRKALAEAAAAPRKNKKICHDVRSDRRNASNEVNLCRALVPYVGSTRHQRVLINSVLQRYLTAATCSVPQLNNDRCLALVPYEGGKCFIEQILSTVERAKVSCQLPEHEAEDDDASDADTTLSWSDEDFSEIIGYSDECLSTFASDFSVRYCAAALDEGDTSLIESDRLTMTQCSLPETQRVEMQQEIDRKEEEELMNSIAELRAALSADDEVTTENRCLALMPYNPPASLWGSWEDSGALVKPIAVVYNAALTEYLASTSRRVLKRGIKRKIENEPIATPGSSQLLKRLRTLDWTNADTTSESSEDMSSIDESDIEEAVAWTEQVDCAEQVVCYPKPIDQCSTLSWCDDDFIDLDDGETDEEQPCCEASEDYQAEAPDENPCHIRRVSSDMINFYEPPISVGYEYRSDRGKNIKLPIVRKSRIIKTKYNKRYRFAPYDISKRKWRKSSIEILDSNSINNPESQRRAVPDRQVNTCRALVLYRSSAIGAINESTRFIFHPELVEYLSFWRQIREQHSTAREVPRDFKRKADRGGGQQLPKRSRIEPLDRQ